jgi:hypothetical protein
VRLYINWETDDADDYKMWIIGPNDENLSGSEALRDYNGGNGNYVEDIGIYPTHLTPLDANALKGDLLGINATGIWKLRIKSDNADNNADWSSLKAAKLYVSGMKDAATDTPSLFTATIIKGDPLWTSWTPFSLTTNIVSNAIKIEMRWNEIDYTDFATDLPVSAHIGVATSDPIVPHEWAYSLSPDAFADNWTTTDVPNIVVTPPTGEMHLKVAARDKLANRGTAYEVMTILSDLVPPEAGNLHCYIDGSTEIPDGTGWIKNTTIRYETEVNGTGSDITSYCYTINRGSQLEPMPGTHAVVPLGTPVSGIAPMSFEVYSSGSPGMNLTEGGNIWCGVKAMDAGGTWSDASYHCITWLDYSAPNNCTMVRPVTADDCNTDNARFAGIQLNKSKFPGSNLTVSMTVTDPGGAGIASGLDKIYMSLDNGVNYIQMEDRDGDLTYTANENWSDPGDDPDNATGGKPYTLAFKTTDRCGNENIELNKVTVYVDTIIPSAPASIGVADKTAEPDHLDGTKADQYSYIAVYNGTKPLNNAINPLYPPPIDATISGSGGTWVPAIGYYLFGNATDGVATDNPAIGNSPLRLTDSGDGLKGEISIYEIDGAGNISPAHNININNAPTINAITLAGTSGNVTINVNLSDLDAPDRVNQVRLTKLEWQSNDYEHPTSTTWYPCANGDLDNSITYTTAVSPNPDVWPFVWSSADQNPNLGAHCLKTTGIKFRASITDGKLSHDDFVSGPYSLNNNTDAVINAAARTLAVGTVRGNIDFTFDVSDANFANTGWEDVMVQLQYSVPSISLGAWQDVPGNVTHFTPAFEHNGNNITYSGIWKSGQTLDGVDDSISLRLKAQDRQTQGGDGTVAYRTLTNGTFNLKNINTKPTCVVTLPGVPLIGTVAGSFVVDDAEFSAGIDEIVNNLRFQYKKHAADSWSTCSGISVISDGGPYTANKTVTFNWNTQTDLTDDYSTDAQFQVLVTDSYSADSDTGTKTGLIVNNNSNPLISCTAPGAQGNVSSVSLPWSINDGGDTGQTYDIEFQATGPTGPLGSSEIYTNTGLSGTYTWNTVGTCLAAGTYGTVTVQFRVKDSERNIWSVWSSDSFTIDRNTEPTISCANPGGQGAISSINLSWTVNDGSDTGQTYDIEFQASGPDGNVASSQIYTDTGKTGTYNWTTVATCLNLGNTGSVTVQFRVKDSMQNIWSGWSTTTFAIDSDTDPTISCANPGTRTSLTVLLNWTINDGSDTGQTYWVEFKATGSDGSDSATQIYTGTSKTGTYNWDASNCSHLGTNGSVTVQFQVKDAQNIWSSWSSTVFNIETNSDPTISCSSPGNQGDVSTVNLPWTVSDGTDVGQTYDIEFKASGPDGSPAETEIYTNTGKTGTYNWSVNTWVNSDSVGTVTVQFRVKDNMENIWSGWSSDSFTIDRNDEPTISVTNPGASSGTSVGIGWSIDDDGETQNYTVEFQATGPAGPASATVQTAASSMSGTYNFDSTACSTTTSGNVTVEFRVKDDVQSIWSGWTAQTFWVDNE